MNPGKTGGKLKIAGFPANIKLVKPGPRCGLVFPDFPIRVLTCPDFSAGNAAPCSILVHLEFPSDLPSKTPRSSRVYPGSCR